MLYDRQAGRPTEHAAITGAIVAAGRRHSVPTPLNNLLLVLLDAGSLADAQPSGARV
jgi:2-dehydropantoate 2-reductase